MTQPSATEPSDTKSEGHALRGAQRPSGVGMYESDGSCNTLAGGSSSEDTISDQIDTQNDTETVLSEREGKEARSFDSQPLVLDTALEGNEGEDGLTHSPTNTFLSDVPPEYLGSLHHLATSISKEDAVLVKIATRDSSTEESKVDKQYFDPVLKATVGGNIHTSMNVLLDTGFIHRGLEVCSLEAAERILAADVTDGQLGYNIVRKWEDYSKLSPAKRRLRHRQITVASGAQISSVGELTCVLHFKCNDQGPNPHGVGPGVFPMEVTLHVFAELTCDIILSNRTLSRVANVFALDYKNKRVLFLNEKDSGYMIKADLPAPEHSWCTRSEMHALRYNIRETTTLVTMDPVHVGVGEKFYIQIPLPNQVQPLKSAARIAAEKDRSFTALNCKRGTPINPVKCRPASGDVVPADPEGRYLVSSVHDEIGCLPYHVQSQHGVSVMLHVDAPQCIAVINNTDASHIVPAGTEVAIIETETSAFNLEDTDGVVNLDLGAIMHTLSQEFTRASTMKPKTDSAPGRVVLTTGPRHARTSSLCRVVGVKQGKNNLVVKVQGDNGVNRKVDLMSSDCNSPMLSRLYSLGEALSHRTTTPEEKRVGLKGPVFKVEGKTIATYKVGEQVVFTRGPRTSASSSVCRVVGVEVEDGHPVYTLQDPDGKQLIMDWSIPEHSLSRIETLANGEESPGFRRINVKGPAAPETEVLIDEDSAQPPCPIPGIDPSDEDRPWFQRLTLDELRNVAPGNYIQPTEDHVKEMLNSEMWKLMQESDVYKNGATWLQELVKDVLLPHAGGMALGAPAAVTSIASHDIILKPNSSAASRQYPLSPEAREQIQLWLRKMLANGFIKRVDSPYRSPLLVVAKKDSGGAITGWRVCFDARKINSLTVDLPGNPAPTAEYLWADMGGSLIFSKTDLKDAFYSVKTTERATKITAFVDPRTGRQYGFTRMPMGLAGSPATMQRVTGEAFADLLGICAFCYVDDLVLYTKQAHIDEVKRIWKSKPEMRQMWQKRSSWDQWKHLEGAGDMTAKAETPQLDHLTRPTSVDDSSTSMAVSQDDMTSRSLGKEVTNSNGERLSAYELAKLHSMKLPSKGDESINSLTSLPTACLFSGIAGLSVGKVNQYCEIDEMAVSILRARMADGTIPKAKISGDITSLKRLTPGTKMIVAGFPCQDFSLAGKQAGLGGTNGKLFWEIPRLVQQSFNDKDPVDWIFLENVASLLSQGEIWQPVYETLSKLGFDGEHITVTAAQAGLPHRRRRWFSLWHRVRDPQPDLTMNVPKFKLPPCGSTIEGKHQTRTQVNIPLCELNPPLVLKPWDFSKYPCRKDAKLINRWPLVRRLIATPRTKGGNDNGNNLTERGSADIATQLKFDSNEVREGEDVGNQVNADYVEHIMGFPVGYTRLESLKNKQHPGCFHNGVNFVPKGVKKLVRRTSINQSRLQVLGNACCPPQAALALRLLTERFAESQQQSVLRKQYTQDFWNPKLNTVTQPTESIPLSAFPNTTLLSNVPTNHSIKGIRQGREKDMSDNDFLLLTHIMQLSSLLNRILFAGLRAQTKKTKVLSREIKILGHLLSDKGLRPCPDKVKAISLMPSPTSQSQVRRALGAFSWFRRFIPKYSKRTSHMRALLKNKVPFHWSQNHEREFRDIISILCSAPLVVCPDPNRQVLVATDASAEGLGGVVYQVGDDPSDIRVIGYYSRSTNSAEKNYDARELETLAVLSTLEKYRAFIPRNVTVLSDHKALGVLDSYVKSNHRLARWAVRLSMWTPNILHRAGKEMELPDWMSRAPISKSLAPVINFLLSSSPTNPNQLQNADDSEFISDSIKIGQDYDYSDVDIHQSHDDPTELVFTCLETQTKPDLTLNVITNRANNQRRLIANDMETVIITGHTGRFPLPPSSEIENGSATTPGVNAMKTRPRAITPKTILKSQIQDRQLRFVRAYLQMPRRDKRSFQMLDRQIIRAYNLSLGEGSGNSTKHRKTPTSEESTTQKPKRVTKKDILNEFCASFNQEAGQMSAAHQELQKMASTIMLEEIEGQKLLVLIQRPINGYLSRTKRDYRLDSTGATTDILRERAVVLGHSLTQDALWFAHASMEGAHQGYAGVLEYLKRYYYWSTMARDAHQYCKRCRLCQLAKQTRRDRFRTITASVPPTTSFQVIYIDLVQIAISPQTQSHEGHTHILTVCDRLTRFVRFEPIKLGLESDAKELAKLEKARDKATTEDDFERISKAIRVLGAKRASVVVANALVNNIFLRLHKVPEVIVTDNGSEFHNELMKHLTTAIGIKLRFISPLNPRSNYVEFIHRPLGNMLKIMVNNHAIFKDVKNWHRYVPYIEHRLNEYKANGQPYTPAQLVLGNTREIHAPQWGRQRISDDEALQQPSTAEKRQLKEYAKELIHFQNTVERVIHFNIMRRQEEDHERFNKKASFHEYEPGDLVQVYNKKIGSRTKESLPTKLILPYIGPCTILKRQGPTSLYKVKVNQGGRVISVATDRLAPYDPNSFTPAEPNSVWKSYFPRTGSDLFLVPGDQVILTSIPAKWLKRGCLHKSDFYVAEFIDYQDEASPGSSKDGLKVKLRLKGNSIRDGIFDPYLAKHLNAWKVKTGVKVGKRDPPVMFSVKDPYPYNRYEPLELTVRTEQILPMFAFNLNRDQSIPSQVKQNILALLNRSANNA